MPTFGDDSLESLMRQADEASEEAKSAEEPPPWPWLKRPRPRGTKPRRFPTRHVSELEPPNERLKGKPLPRVDAAKREADALVAETTKEAEERVRRARGQANEYLEQERRAATAIARDRIEESRAESQAEIDEAQHKAEEAGRRAEQAIEEASQALKRARDLATQVSGASKRRLPRRQAGKPNVSQSKPNNALRKPSGGPPRLKRSGVALRP